MFINKNSKFNNTKVNKNYYKFLNNFNLSRTTDYDISPSSKKSVIIENIVDFPYEYIADVDNLHSLYREGITLDLLPKLMVQKALPKTNVSKMSINIPDNLTESFDIYETIDGKNYCRLGKANTKLKDVPPLEMLLTGNAHRMLELKKDQPLNFIKSIDETNRLTVDIVAERISESVITYISGQRIDYNDRKALTKVINSKGLFDAVVSALGLSNKSSRDIAKSIIIANNIVVAFRNRLFLVLDNKNSRYSVNLVRAISSVARDIAKNRTLMKYFY